MQLLYGRRLLAPDPPNRPEGGAPLTPALPSGLDKRSVLDGICTLSHAFQTLAQAQAFISRCEPADQPRLLAKLAAAYAESGWEKFAQDAFKQITSTASAG